jgi:hypothetical protein
MNFVDRHGVKEPLHHRKHSRKSPRRIDDVKLAETLRIVVLRNTRGGLDVRVHTAGFRQTDTLHVHDCAACFEEMARLAAASGKTWIRYLLVLAYQVGEHAVGGRNLVHGGEVDVAEGLNVYWSAILESVSL